MSSNSPFFSVKSDDFAPIKSHKEKAKAIKAAGENGYIFDKILDIQMYVVKNDQGDLELDISPDASFNFKSRLYEESILTSHY